MLENVRGLLDAAFDAYRSRLERNLRRLGYVSTWRLLQASDYGVPQLRPRAVLIALRADERPFFTWPEPSPTAAPSVGRALLYAMGSAGWSGAEEWAARADRIAPTLVGGSKKHGGPDLGPTRAKRAWAELGVDGHGIADAPPQPGFCGVPRLTNAMAAILQGFPDNWVFAGRKTAAYRQIGNAFPPPVARAVGAQLALALSARARQQSAAAA
jgi:DNA (cytosine-5)-methyltransferase 1